MHKTSITSRFLPRLSFKYLPTSSRHFIAPPHHTMRVQLALLLLSLVVASTSPLAVADDLDYGGGVKKSEARPPMSPPTLRRNLRQTPTSLLVLSASRINPKPPLTSPSVLRRNLRPTPSLPAPRRNPKPPPTSPLAPRRNPMVTLTSPPALRRNPKTPPTSPPALRRNPRPTPTSPPVSRRNPKPSPPARRR